MKRIVCAIIALSLTVLLTACGSPTGSESDGITIFANAFRSYGISVKSENKPLYAFIGAVDGIIFYVDTTSDYLNENTETDDSTAVQPLSKNNCPVKIYEFNSDSDAEKAQSGTKYLRNGRFLLETESQQAQTIFSGVNLSPETTAESSEEDIEETSEEGEGE